MEQADDQTREIAELRDRLSRLSQASLRINESLDFDYGAPGGAGQRLLPDRDRATASSPSWTIRGGYRTS